ncbi:type I restriction-modification system endonuclease [Acuticoccus sp.]|uniref:type I restriction-modification system endonuclease n=1 Tax=Acuticoccus sp. TaxID=1904378 RepID=UPI003B52D610
MPNPIGNFAHIEEFDPSLAFLGARAEAYFADDPNTALIKTRQFAERLAAVVAERSGIELSPGEAFVDTLRKIQSASILPRELIDALHRIRKAGNTAVHDLHGERREAFDALKLCHRLGVWLRASVTNKPDLTIAFVPPPARADDSAELKEAIAELQERLAAAEGQAARAMSAMEEASTARLSAEERATQAEEERQILEELALEAERRATTEPTTDERIAFAAAAAQAARSLDLDEADTRLIVDEQLRTAGWDADTVKLRYSEGTRQQCNRNLAIAEWPTANGPADFALFVGEKLVGLVEAKRKRTEVAAAVDQAGRYSRGVQWTTGGTAAGGPWEDFQVPFVFATNGRGYYPQFHTQSGIWFRDVRRSTNGARPLEGWPTPEGLTEQLEIDVVGAEATLAGRSFNFDFQLRHYQIDAIKAVEEKLAEGRRAMLIAMATGTGKTKLSIALIYRLLNAKRFNRICFVVDRSTLGEQAEQAFDTTKMVGARTFADIFGLKGLADRDIDRDVRVHVCTVQSLVQRVLARTPDERPPVDQYDLIIVDECHRGYLLDREMSDAELTFRSQEDYVSKYRRALEYFDAVKVGLTATPALHTAQIFGQPIYRYSYRDAVIDGWLVDHDPPHLITTALSKAGITFQPGETIEAFNPQTGEVDTATLDDKLASPSSTSTAASSPPNSTAWSPRSSPNGSTSLTPTSARPSSSPRPTSTPTRSSTC